MSKNESLDTNGTQDYVVTQEQLLEDIQVALKDVWDATMGIENGKLLIRFSNGKWFTVAVTDYKEVQK